MKTYIIFSSTLRKFDMNLYEEYMLKDANIISLASCNYKYRALIPQTIKKFIIPIDLQLADNNNILSIHYHNNRAYNGIIKRYDLNSDDIIIKYCSDVIPSMAFPHPTKPLEDNTIYVPECNNDNIAYGNVKSMEIYCNLYYSIRKYVEDDNITFDNKTLINHHMSINEIHIKTFKFDYSLNANITDILPPILALKEELQQIDKEEALQPLLPLLLSNSISSIDDYELIEKPENIDDEHRVDLFKRSWRNILPFA